jgi:hypothetical protein
MPATAEAQDFTAGLEAMIPTNDAILGSFENQVQGNLQAVLITIFRGTMVVMHFTYLSSFLK